MAPGPRPYRRSKVPGPGLHLGECGLAVARAYLARASGDPAERRRARRHLERALGALERVELSGAFATGLPGIAWTLAHLQREGFLEPDEDLAAALDEAMLDAVASRTWKGDHEQHMGLAGLGTAALERLPRRAARRTLEHVVRHLDQGARRAGAGLTWPGEDDAGAPRYLLGVPHGVAGPIAFLARARALGVAPGRSRRLLEGAVAFLLGAELPASARSRFPYQWIPGAAGAPCRSAWCHGDAGIAAALLSAARAAREPAWAKAAIRVARSAAARPFKDAGIVDATVCHGAFGTAHLLNRMFHATRDPVLGRGARRFLGRGLQLLRAAESGRARWPELGQRGLLIGDAGMALVLLAATTHIEPRWDRALSVNISP